MWIWWTKINLNPSILGRLSVINVYLWLNEEIEHDEKVTLTPK